jgi:C-terminal processing protease CtpA/Prc
MMNHTQAKGVKVTEVIAGGPFDKSTSKLKAGQIIEKIDGEEITDDVDWNKFMTVNSLRIP